MKSKGYRRGGAAGMSRRTAPISKEAGPSKARSGAGTGRSISELSDAQKNLLRSVQSAGRKQPTGVIDELTKKYGNLAARKQRQDLKARAPKPPGMNMGGAAMKTKGYAKGGAAMKTKGSAKGGVRKPSSKKSGLYGR